MKAAFGADPSPAGAAAATSPANLSGATYERNYILCHVRRVIAKDQEEEDGVDGVGNIHKQASAPQASKIPNKLPKLQDPIKPAKVDLKVVKSMTAEELAAAKLTTIGPDGKPKLLSAYKQKKLLLAQQQQVVKKNPDIIQINQGPTKRRKKTPSEGEDQKGNKYNNNNDRADESYTDRSGSGTAGYIDASSSSNVQVATGPAVLKNP